MLDKKNIAILVGTIVLIVGFVVWGLQAEPEAPVTDPSAIVYYYGDGCPHCKVVQDFIDANNITEKVSFEKKEVWKNRKNAKELEARAAACSIKPEDVGVPFVYGGDGKCYVGEPDVRKFFSEKAGIDAATE
jgi:glutaredoxin